MMVGELHGDVRRTSYVTCLEVRGMGPFPQRDAVAHLPDPPGTLGHLLEVVRTERLDRVGICEEGERLSPRILRCRLASVVGAAHVDVAHPLD